MCLLLLFDFFFSSRRRHTRLQGDWSSDVCSSDLVGYVTIGGFDTHSNQRNQHQRLLQSMSDGLKAFWDDLTAQGKADKIGRASCRERMLRSVVEAILRIKTGKTD